MGNRTTLDANSNIIMVGSLIRHRLDEYDPVVVKEIKSDGWFWSDELPDNGMYHSAIYDKMVKNYYNPEFWVLVGESSESHKWCGNILKFNFV